MTKNAADDRNHLGPTGMILLLVALCAIVGGASWSIVRMRKTLAVWTSLLTSGPTLANQCIADVRADQFDKVKAECSTAYRARFDQAEIDRLKKVSCRLAPIPVVSGFTSTGGSLQFGFGTNGSGISEKPPRLDYRLQLSGEASEPEDLTLIVTVEDGKTVIDDVVVAPRLKSPIPPTRPAPLAPQPGESPVSPTDSGSLVAPTAPPK